MDVLSFRLKWRPGDPQELFAVIRKGLLMAMIYRGDYWQVALLMPKGFNPLGRFPPVSPEWACQSHSFGLERPDRPLG